ELDPWEREHDPYKGEDKTGYGFTTVITATPVGAAPQAAEAVWKKNLKKIRLAAKEAKKAKTRAEAAKAAANQPQDRQAFVPQPHDPQAVAPRPTLR
ncbi:MAG TPA: hypothetical protein VKP69_07170, partial [Isosphaeraceae bacterium]|nr:hypothetical protein [Isosphaeraceae bacterium]